MTQKEHDDVMHKLRQEFDRLWKLQLFPKVMLWLPAKRYNAVQDIVWKAFTHGKIPKVDA